MVVTVCKRDSVELRRMHTMYLKYFANTLIISLLCTTVNCYESDPFSITVQLCDDCYESSYKYATIEPQEKQQIDLMVPRSSHFFIIQVHSPQETVRLSYEPEAHAHNSVRGTNIGLNQLTADKNVHYFYLFGNFTTEKRILFAVTSYSKEAPIPGGCNIEFETESAPYQHVSYDNAMITVDVQSPSINSFPCEASNNVSLEFYQLFTDNYGQNLNDSFAKIIQMLTVHSIRSKSYLVVKPWKNPRLRRYFNNYQGFGAVFVVIATYKNVSSAYVPAITYGCDMTKGDKSCITQVKTILWYEMKVLWFLNVLLLFSNFVKLGSFFNLSFYATLAALVYTGYDDLNFTYVFLVISAIIVTILMTLLLRRFQINKLVFRLYVAHLIVIVLFPGTANGNYEFYQTPAYFWILYTATLLIMALPKCNKLALTLFIVIQTIVICDILFGNSALIYYNINAIRIATVRNFHLASLRLPPTLHVLNAFIWFVIIVISVLCQKLGCANREEQRPLLV